MVLTVLMIAEKPSLSSAISAILSNGNHDTRTGVCKHSPVHEWTGRFEGQVTAAFRAWYHSSPLPPLPQAARFKMSAVLGHVLQTDFEGTYNEWDKHPPSALFEAPIVKKVPLIPVEFR